MRNRVQKIIDRAGVRIGGILSDVFGVNGRKILDGLAQGTAREANLAALTSHVVNKLEGLGEALTLSLGDNDHFMLSGLLGGVTRLRRASRRTPRRSTSR